MTSADNGQQNGDHEPRIDDGNFRLLVASFRDYAICMLDATGHVVTWNAGAETMKGYTQKEILGSHVSRFYPTERIEQGWPDHALEMTAAHGRFEDEGWQIRKDGSRFWANVVITALHDDAGHLVGFGMITSDLTEHRRQTEDLRRSEARFRAMVESVSDYAIFMLDPAGFVSTWNPGAERLKGYSASEIIGCHFSTFYPPAAIKSGWPAHELRMATLQGRFEDEGWRVRKDGSRFWANVVISAIRDASGNLLGFAKVTRDLTERRKHEEELRRSEQRFRLLVEGVADYAIMMLDTNGVISSWNGGAVRILGYPAADILGKHLSHFYTSEDVVDNRPWKDLATARADGRVATEGWRVRKDGTLFWAQSALTVLHDSEGEPYGFANVTQDLTQRRHAESLADTAQRMHEFIAMLAHELRNPLAPIRNAVALMGRKGLGDPTLESMRQTIDRQSTLLARLIDELLDVNRIAHGKFDIQKETVDLVEVLRRSVEASRPFIDAMGHRLHQDVPQDSVYVQGDSLRLTQAIVNILNNASKFTPNGGDIWLTLRRRDTEVEIRVRDSGKGIAREHLNAIFDLFTQVNPEKNGANGGLGVGLALVRRVIELHAGTVQAKSDGPGQGAEFVIKLPRPAEGLKIVHGHDRPTQARRTARTLRILVVDDNRDAADSLYHLLKTLGHDVYSVYDGPSALLAADAFHPHVVMLDIGMPHMSGYDVAARLRTPPSSAPVLIAITGWAQHADRMRSREVGFDYHFSKPVSEMALEEVLSDVAARLSN